MGQKSSREMGEKIDNIEGTERLHAQNEIPDEIEIFLNRNLY